MVFGDLFAAGDAAPSARSAPKGRRIDSVPGLTPFRTPQLSLVSGASNQTVSKRCARTKAALIGPFPQVSALGGIRTPNLLIRSQML